MNGPLKSSTVFSKSGPPGGPPELFTRMSIFPIFEANSETDSKSSMSIAKYSWPEPCISETSSCSSSAVLAHAITLHPALAKTKAVALPMPFDAPQTRAVFPFKIPSAKGKPLPSKSTSILSPNRHSVHKFGLEASP